MHATVDFSLPIGAHAIAANSKQCKYRRKCATAPFSQDFRPG